jgi:hypothetical protein
MRLAAIAEPAAALTSEVVDRSVMPARGKRLRTIPLDPKKPKQEQKEEKMKPTSKTSTASAATALAFAFFAIAAPAAHAADYCITSGAQTAHGCGYPTMEACQAASAGIGGICSASGSAKNPSDALGQAKQPRSASQPRLSKQPAAQ